MLARAVTRRTSRWLMSTLRGIRFLMQFPKGIVNCRRPIQLKGRASGGRFLPFFVKESGVNDFFWKCRRRWLPSLGTRRDSHHSPVPEAGEKEIVERGKFIFVEGMAAI